MTRCTVCLDSRRQAVDAALAAGRSARSLAAEYGLSPDAMKRHARTHALIPERATAPRSADGDPLGELIEALRQRALDGSNPAHVREYRLALATQAERTMERPAYDVLADPGWLELRLVILEALRPFPAAGLAIADALGRRGA